MEISFMQHTLIGIWQKLTVCPLNQVNIPFTNGKKQGIFTPCYAINLTFFKTKKAIKRWDKGSSFIKSQLLALQAAYKTSNYTQFGLQAGCPVWVKVLAPHTSMSSYIFSILFFIHFQRGQQGEFVQQSRAASVGDHLLYSHDFHVWFRGHIVRRN